MEILLTAEPISAQKAYHYGIVNEVVPLADLMPTALRYAELICKNAPLAVRKVKESAVKGLGMPLKEALDQEMVYAGEVFSTEDAMEGILAFQQKRSPVWKGK
jgi:enoyl-CoA hydratase/carnithine racemase